MKWNRKIIEWVLSVGIPISVVAGLYLKLNTDHNQEAAYNARQARVGDAITLSGTDWGRNRLTLVMVMQVGCHWCEESAPFYRDLAKQESAGHKFHIIASLPQTTTKSLEFLQTLGIGVQDIRQEELGSLGVAGTPTLILVDHAGRIKSIWVGKLPLTSEKEVLNTLGIADKSG